jgi:hypothetical protein
VQYSIWLSKCTYERLRYQGNTKGVGRVKGRADGNRAWM